MGIEIIILYQPYERAPFDMRIYATLFFADLFDSHQKARIPGVSPRLTSLVYREHRQCDILSHT